MNTGVKILRFPHFWASLSTLTSAELSMTLTKHFPLLRVIWPYTFGRVVLMLLWYNRLSPSPGIYGHQRGHSSFFGGDVPGGATKWPGALVFWSAKHTLSTYLPVGYRDPKYGPSSCSFLIGSSFLTGGGGHFDCDLNTMCDRKTRIKKGTSTLSAI